MSVGFVMLCHTALDRAARVARHWAASGAPVVIHIDRRTARAEAAAMEQALADVPGISFSPRFACEWGSFGLVRATLAAAAQMLARHADVRHVFLASGACLPLRPLRELADYLAAHPDTDFIESVTTSDVGWTKGGLDAERFTLRFPLSWQRQRRLFDAYTWLQRRLGVRRRIPLGLVPHLGSQWWCLTRTTLDRIVTDPNRPVYDRYFRRVWIPDESYFQTLARLHSRTIESRSLTLSKFDQNGRPYVFYDDHQQLLKRSDCFVARKIWPRAERLYQTFLATPDVMPRKAEPSPGKIDKLFARAVDRRVHGRPGLYMQSRFPRRGQENGCTAGPYSVFHGFSEVFEHFDAWVTRTTGLRTHGHLFAPQAAEFAGREPTFHGAVCASAAVRDYNPQSFLTNLIWNTRGERQCFLTAARDRLAIMPFISQDQNAQVSVVTGAWAIPLAQSNEPFATIRRTAASLQKAEVDLLRSLQARHAKASVRVWSLADFIENPMEPLQAILDEINPRNQMRLTEAPRMADLAGLPYFLQTLKNQGMLPALVGDIGRLDDLLAAPAERARPYLVR